MRVAPQVAGGDGGGKTSYARLIREIIEAYHLDFEQVGRWTMEQLYIAVVDKDKLPKEIKPGTVTMSYEEAIAAGIIRSGESKSPRPLAPGETIEDRMDRVFRQSLQPKKIKPPHGTRQPVNATEIVKEPRRRRRKHGDK